MKTIFFIILSFCPFLLLCGQSVQLIKKPTSSIQENNSTLNSVIRTSDGKIWIRERKGIIQYNPQTKKHKSFFSSYLEKELGTSLFIG